MSFWSKFGSGLSKVAAVANSPIVAPLVTFVPGGGIATAAIHEIGVIDATTKQAQSASNPTAIGVAAATGALQTLRNVVEAEGKTVPADLEADTESYIKNEAPAFLAKGASLERRWHELL